MKDNSFIYFSIKHRCYKVKKNENTNIHRKVLYMNDKELKSAAKAAKNAYHKAWRAANRDKVKEYNQRYWENRIKKIVAKEDNNA